MFIYEYQAKKILKKYGINIPNGRLVSSIKEAVEVAETINADYFFIKVQVLSGRRGLNGGIIKSTLSDIKKNADSLLGKRFITDQTGERGDLVTCILIEEGIKIKKEIYLGITIDRKINRVIILISGHGGMNIEEMAETYPEKVFKTSIDPLIGLSRFQVRKLAYEINIPEFLIDTFINLLINLYNIFIENDCFLLEINPLVISEDNILIALDAKIIFDPNSIYRNVELQKIKGMNIRNAEEEKAEKIQLNYIILEGNIGCIVNGAGLAMATMDMIKLYGGMPANFLDVGGGATVEKINEAFKILSYSSYIKGIFVNIFGGVLKCDIVATAIVLATREINIVKPLVIRLEGTNKELGIEVLRQSGLNIIITNDISEGVKEIIDLVKN